MSPVQLPPRSETVADQMVSSLQRISSALDELKEKGLPEVLIIAYLEKKTHLGQRNIRLVLDGLRDLNREIKK